MLLKAANTLNYRVLTVGVLLIFIASFSTLQFPCIMLTIIHFMLALKYLLNITVEKLWRKIDKENKLFPSVASCLLQKGSED